MTNYIYICVCVFPNRIENGKRKQATAAAHQLLLCSWPVRLGFCFDATCIKFHTYGSLRNPSKLVDPSAYLTIVKTRWEWFCVFLTLRLGDLKVFSRYI